MKQAAAGLGGWTSGGIALAGLMLLAATGQAVAEDTICMPEYAYNTGETPPLVIPLDADRRAGSVVTSIDIETGSFHRNLGAQDGPLIESGTLTIVNRGSLQERIDFVALNPANATLLHISLIDEGLPFTLMDAEGTVTSGHCVYEYDQ